MIETLENLFQMCQMQENKQQKEEQLAKQRKAEAANSARETPAADTAATERTKQKIRVRLRIPAKRKRLSVADDGGAKAGLASRGSKPRL